MTILLRKISGGILFCLAASPMNAAYATELPSVVVSADRPAAGRGAYNQPSWAGKGRFSSTTDAYVQDPFCPVLDLDYQLTVPRHGRPSHLFTEEVELGLPGRFLVAYEHQWEVKERHTQTLTHNFELRWAPANWGKLPLNPTLLLEYKVGAGTEREDEAEDEREVEPEGAKEKGEPEAKKEEVDGERKAGEHRRKSRDIPDALEERILLSEEFGKFQWAMNLFHEQELGGEREVEWGFSQALIYSPWEEFGVGVEMQFIHRSTAETRGDSTKEFDIGPSISARFGRRVDVSLAALFGTTEDSPKLSVFAVVSVNFGPGRESETHTPVSTRNR